MWLCAREKEREKGKGRKAERKRVSEREREREREWRRERVVDSKSAQATELRERETQGEQAHPLVPIHTHPNIAPGPCNHGIQRMGWDRAEERRNRGGRTVTVQGNGGQRRGQGMTRLTRPPPTTVPPIVRRWQACIGGKLIVARGKPKRTLSPREHRAPKLRIKCFVIGVENDSLTSFLVPLESRDSLPATWRAIYVRIIPTKSALVFNGTR